MDYKDMIYISKYLFVAGEAISYDKTANHATRAVASICFELSQKIERKMIGEVKKKYRLKLKHAEIEALLYIKNEFLPNASADYENSVVRLLQEQKTKLC